jgi:hypothetical protein
VSEWTTGYTQDELDAAQERFQLPFPPDLVDLFCDRRPLRGYDWRVDHEDIIKVLKWPLEGIIFDIENNSFWPGEWGARPTRKDERAEIATTVVAQAPKLIPLISHRFLPTEPFERGNPVFSIHQTDIIYYGANLLHYFGNEFGGWSDLEPSAYRRIRFWSDFTACSE